MPGALSRAACHLSYFTTSLARFLARRVSPAVSGGPGGDADRVGRADPAAAGPVWRLGADGPDRRLGGGGSRLGHLARGLFERLARAGPIPPRGKRSAGSDTDGQHRRRALRGGADGHGAGRAGSPSHRSLWLRPISSVHGASVAEAQAEVINNYPAKVVFSPASSKTKIRLTHLNEPGELSDGASPAIAIS